MTIKERIELGKLGYTKAEISAMIDEEKAVPSPEEKPEVKPEAQQSNKADMLMASIEKLTKALQDNALYTAEQPNGAAKTESVDDILDTILK